MQKYIVCMIGLGMIGAVGFMGCGESDGPVHPDVETTERNQAVTVTPEFSITGTEFLPDELYLAELGLSITEIRLEPISGRNGVAYSTSKPIRLSFDVADGELVKRGAAVKFPEAGRFLVSVRLEPIEHYDQVKGAQVTESSLSIAGFVAGTDGRTLSGNHQDGNPLPLPFDEIIEESNDDQELTERDGSPMDWTPFHYDSKRAVFYTFSDVELSSGEQYLTFTFDIRDWAVELIEPIVRAVNSSTSPSLSGGQGVDITSQLDSTGSGTEAFMDSATVGTSPQQPGVDPGL
ncbi:MAG: hypothetical protein ACNA8W_10850 [Bradymonadaceae bacterium]